MYSRSYAVTSISYIVILFSITSFKLKTHMSRSELYKTSIAGVNDLYSEFKNNLLNDSIQLFIHYNIKTL